LDKAEGIAKTVQSILRLYSDIQPALQVCRNSPIKQDIEQQLGMMIYSGFLLSTPYSRLLEFPRYLKAILHRLEKAAQDPLRDLKQFKEVDGFKQRYLQALLREQGRLLPEADPFRWMLEEFRVSLFAQQLKTAFPVSVKRLEEAWQQRSSLKD
jgi:ATP-dependent helicase HrpA